MSDFSDAIAEPKWYVAHTYTGYENKVKASLEKLVENRGLQDKIMETCIPVEIHIEKKGDQEIEVEEKILPSYVLVKMIMSDETWHVVRNISGVTGFVGPGSKPVPLTDEEVAAFKLEKVREIVLRFAVGDSVKITAGPLSGFVGTVQEISADKKKVKVLASMFGRETPVELDTGDVQPLEI